MIFSEDSQGDEFGPRLPTLKISATTHQKCDFGPVNISNPHFLYLWIRNNDDIYLMVSLSELNELIHIKPCITPDTEYAP